MNAQAFVHPEFLVSTDWLAGHLDNTVRVLDCTYHLIPDPPRVYIAKPGREDFEAGHIPGAAFVDLQADLSRGDTGLRFMTPSPDAFAAAMGRIGVGAATRVVLYSTANVWWASRVWWLLRHFGFDNAAVLDGGFQKWKAEGRAVATGAAAAVAAASFPNRGDRGLMADKGDVLAAIGDGGVCTVNALRADQHSGTGGVAYGRPGHIKGSVNVPAMHLIDPVTNAFRSPAEIRAAFAAIGALDRPVIAYCGGGIAASADALMLTMLGHDKVRIYDASLSEWATDPSLPMETGA